MRHFVYIVRCNDDSLYTGYCLNVNERIKVHNDGRGAKYTNAKKPVTLVYRKWFLSKRKALQREAEIKKFSKKEKEQLIKDTPL